MIGNPGPAPPDYRQPSPAALLVVLGGVLLAVSPFLAWVNVFVLGNVNLFELLQAARVSQRWGWTALGVGVGLVVLGSTGLQGGRHLRPVALVMAVVMGVAGGPGVLRLVTLVSRSRGSLSIGAGVVVLGLAELLLLLGGLVASSTKRLDAALSPRVLSSEQPQPTGTATGSGEPGSGSRPRRMSRWAKTVVSILTLALVAALVAGIVVVSNQSTTHSSPQPLPHGLAPSKSPAQTIVIVYKPFTPSGIASGIAVTATMNGSCWEGSLTASRPDAFRCTAGNEIFDPCFSDPYGQTQVACPSDASQVVVLNLTEPLPSNPASQLANSPWLFELVDGATCSVNTGTTSTSYGMSISGGCSNSAQWVGSINDSVEPWTVLVQFPGSSELVSSEIIEAWE